MLSLWHLPNLLRDLGQERKWDLSAQLLPGGPTVARGGLCSLHLAPWCQTHFYVIYEIPSSFLKIRTSECLPPAPQVP